MILFNKKSILFLLSLFILTFSKFTFSSSYNPQQELENLLINQFLTIENNFAEEKLFENFSNQRGKLGLEHIELTIESYAGIKFPFLVRVRICPEIRFLWMVPH